MEESFRHNENENLILLVEPEPANRARLEQIFCESGWKVTASDGTSPLPQKKEEEPSIILVSAGREGFDEIEFIRSVRSNKVTEKTPLVVLADRDQIRDGLSSALLKEGADDIALEPFTKVRLVARVKAHVCLAHLRREDQEYVPRAFEEWGGTGSDMTERTSAEEALRASEERLRLILESSTDFAIFTTDLEGKVTMWNAGAEHLLGYSDDEICGTDFHRIFTPEDVEGGAPDEEMKSAFETGRGADQRWHQRKDGSRFWADGMLMPLRNKDGDACGYLKIIRDFTEQKKSQDELHALTEELEKRVEERTKQLEESRTRLRSLIFELNKAEQMERQRIAAELHDKPAQLLTAARLSLEAAAREAGETSIAPSLRKVETIISEATRATRHLMTDLSGPRVLEHDDLVVTIQWVVDKMRESGLSVELSSNEARIPLDRDLLTLIFQTVRELLQNVLKHAGVSEAFIHIYRSDERVEIEVIDHGRGFEPNETVEAPGPTGGFGLLNLYERLRWLGGKLDIQAAPGRGTRAKVLLPLKPDAVIPPEEPASASTAKRPKREGAEAERIAVLLVDDHRMVREGFRSLIEERPDICVVGEAGDGAEALKNARDLQPDVVIMDINMPRMNGLEATRRLLEEMPDVTVIGLSLHGHDDMADAIKKAGAAAYVSKEEACDTLCDVIRDEYHKRHPEPAPSE